MPGPGREIWTKETNGLAPEESERDPPVRRIVRNTASQVESPSVDCVDHGANSSAALGDGRLGVGWGAGH